MPVPDPYIDIQAALAASGIGTWHTETGSGKITIDAIAAGLLGLRGAGLYAYSELLAHADHKEAPLVQDFISGIHNAVQGDTISSKIRLNPQNNRIRLLFKGSTLSSDNGNLTTGTVQEIRNSNFYEPQVGEWDLKSIIAEAPLAVALYVGRELLVGIANDIMLSYWGKDRTAIGLTLEKAVPELEGQPFLEILDNVFTTGQIYQVFEAPARLALNGVLDVYYFDFTYKPMYNEDGEIYAILNTAVNVTDRVITKRKKQEADNRIRAIVEQSPVAIAFLSGREMIVEVGNDKIFKIWGKSPALTGLPLETVLPEIKSQGFIDLLEGVYETGETFYGYNYLARLEHDGVLKDMYFDFTYSALRDENDEINGILVLAIDVSDKINYIKKVEENEARVRAIINSSPAAMAVFRGRDLVVDVTNKAFMDIVGRDKEIIGMPLGEAMPEINGQRSMELMWHVMETGEKVHNYARQVNIMRNGIMTQNYYNVSYTPLFDAEGNVSAVLDVAIDVTDTIKSRQAIEEAEASLRGAIELAELGTWSLYPESGMVTYSKRMLNWFGLDGKPEDINDILQSIHEKDRDRVTNAIAIALTLGSKGHYDEEYTVINRHTGRERILHAQGRAFFNEKGEPYLMTGTAQDITAHKKIQKELEEQVNERTEELQLANIELEKANSRLLSSNEELAQYAYVASHDLQEPLRKISMFSNLLREKDSDGRHAAVIEKILKSSNRMSLLIKDLLEFSRLLNPDIRFTEVNLNEIVSAVVTDFELLIEEKNAVISVDDLKRIEAVPLQMNQLFYNLINNALKFTAKDKKPEISVTCRIAGQDEVNAHLPNADMQEYYVFSVNDNGIGIREEYLKQIFEVFKRLHGREEYSGSGIGLAICRRIVNNHNGAIFIESQPGVGTSFHIMLPQKQKNKIVSR